MKQRVFTSLIGIPLVLGAVFCAKPWPVAVLLTLVSAAGLLELSRLFPSGRSLDFGRLSAGAAAWVASALVAIREDLWGLSGILFVLGVLYSLRLPKSKSPLAFGMASFWVLVPLASVFRLWQMGLDDPSAWWNWRSFTLLVLFPLWAGDSAGIFVGRCCGKRLLAPKISPKKTWEGAAANAVSCLALAAAVGWAVGISLPAALLCGALCAVFGQAGDLFESWLKRLADVKDSGSLLPGHGGILDRIDSVLFSSPLVAMALGFWR